jgi:cobalt-zinc-cadmium resistance protein CzcA
MNAVIAFALKHRVLMLVLFVMMLFGGTVAFRQLNIEAYPDPTPPMVDVVTQGQGLSAEEIERYITIPIETQTAALRNLTSIRTISLYGLSDVKLQFTFDFTYDEALQQVLNRLSQLPQLPNGAQPQISPVSPIGEIYRYKLAGPPGYSVLDLKTLQDWVLQRRFRAVPGVIDVTGWGGKMFELLSLSTSRCTRLMVGVLCSPRRIRTMPCTTSFSSSYPAIPRRGL